MTNPVSGNYELIEDEFLPENIFDSSPAKNLSKPEIIVLDGLSSVNCSGEATLSMSKCDDNLQKESEEHLCLNEENIDDKNDKKSIFPVPMETVINTSVISELKVGIGEEFDSYEIANKNNMNKVTEVVKNEAKSKECSGIFEDDIKIEIPFETSVKVSTILLTFFNV